MALDALMRESSHDPPEACHPTPPRVPLPPGATIGGAYRVTALPGTGAMGEVYRARDTRLGRDVAVKLLPPSAKAEGGRELGALSEEVSLGTHIRDVVTLLEREGLHDVVLVGHSYGGMIITGAGELARRRIAHLVYIDAFVPEHRQSALQLLPDPTRDLFSAAGRRRGRMAAPPERPPSRAVDVSRGS